MTAFWDAAPCSLVEAHRRFRRTASIIRHNIPQGYHLHIRFQNEQVFTNYGSFSNDSGSNRDLDLTEHLRRAGDTNSVITETFLTVALGTTRTSTESLIAR
jgi:hypothetical protein